MTYMKPEMAIEKFELIENITGDIASAANVEPNAVDSQVVESAVASVASDMIIG